MWSTLITNPRKIMQNTFFLHFPFYFFFFILKKITKATYHEMHECYAMQILKKKIKIRIKIKIKKQRRMVTKSGEMKHKDQESQR